MGVKGANAGAKHYAWKGGRVVHENRVLISTPGHPRAHKRAGYVFEHILVAERALGHYLDPKAVVHHVDEDSLNNRNDNLAILPSRGYHMSLHRRLRVLRAGGDPWSDYLCATCSQLKKADAFPKGRKPGEVDSVCRECRRQYAQDLRDGVRRSA